MKLRIVSDLHLEFDDGDTPYPITPGKKDTTLILPGDISVWATHRARLMDFLKIASSQFERVLFVPGNHEYYHGDLLHTRKQMDSDIMNLADNVFFLDGGILQIPGTNILFAGSTLWTNLDNSNPATMFRAMNSINDFTEIMVDGKRLNQRHWLDRHEAGLYMLFQVMRDFPGFRVVVITHHLPSYQSVPLQYKGSPANPTFASNLDYHIESGQPVLWVHGHTHDSNDYMIEKTRVVCNPRGYSGYELNPNFNPSFEVTI